MQFRNVEEEALWCQAMIEMLKRGHLSEHAGQFADIVVDEYRKRVPEEGYTAQPLGCPERRRANMQAHVRSAIPVPDEKSPRFPAVSLRVRPVVASA